MIHLNYLKKIFFSLIFTSVVTLSFSQTAEWIWYPGDYEVWLHRELSLKRNELGAVSPTFWRLDSHYGLVAFSKRVKLTSPEKVRIASTGKYSIRLDMKFFADTTTIFEVPAGEHDLVIFVVNYEDLPALYVEGDAIISDSTWNVSNGNTKHYPAAQSNFNDVSRSPLKFKFQYTMQEAVNTERDGNNLLLDFGKETFGYLQLLECSNSGEVTIYYGESKEEALDANNCEVLEILTIPEDSLQQFTIPVTRGFRYAYIIPEEGMQVGKTRLLYEYLPLDYIGNFKSSNDELNKIYEISAYTLHLTSREMFLDGIKRDRWVWSGDAAQSALMNYYLFFDKEIVKRTLWGLRGKDPVETHINTILDYSYYWFISIYDYYLYTGDKEFIKSIYPRMITLMDFCTSRLNENGFTEGLENDWVFLDWADIDKRGELSAYQLLFVRSLETMGECATILNDTENAEKYKKWSEDLKVKTFDTFFDKKKNQFLHQRIDGELQDDVTRYAAIFGMLFNYVDKSQAESLKNNTLLNDSLTKITTPYMRFYELAALCEADEHVEVMNQMLDYWGGMLKLGATSFWEVYNPDESGMEHYAMYNRKFGRSLCHSWGASPIYLIGKYFLGVKPTSFGYKTFTVNPHLGGLEWIEGTVPINNGQVNLFMDKKEIKLSVSQPGGKLLIYSKKKPKSNEGILSIVGKNIYSLELEKTNFDYQISYTPVIH